MSFVFTLKETTTSTFTSTVYLSPSKKNVSPAIPALEAGSSIKDIYSWILVKSSESIAACSIRNALEMKPNENQGFDFYWLGRVPCRTVKIVGMTVGIQIYEKRIIYSIDDGTGVIDCNHIQPPAIHNTKKKQEEPLPSLKPMCRVGSFVCVIGNVRPHHDSRVIAVDSIVCCSPNDELHHVREIRNLHKTSYSGKKPFVIPPPKIPQTPQKKHVLSTPSTLQSSPPSSISSSPVKQLDPCDLPRAFKSPIKLRHPSRLHTHDVNENTFRIYLKHYMDNAPNTADEDDYDTDSDNGTVLAPSEKTPTKRSRHDSTPRPFSSYRPLGSTPRPRVHPLNFGVPSSSRTSSTLASTSTFTDDPQKGFTLSYLRRVPELSLLASRVVHATTKRRIREQKQRLKDAGVVPSSQQKAEILAMAKVPRAAFAKKKKRLFQWAIIELHKEGSLVHWDGPVRACPDNSIANASVLWKTIGDGSSLFSMSSASSSLIDTGEIDEGALSDPDLNEEAYVSMTPDFLARFVENAIKVLVNHYEKIGRPYAGATKEGILSVLRKDDRWRNVGEWSIEDALVLLDKQGRISSIGKGRWDLTE